jgi:hypothetical protein
MAEKVIPQRTDRTEFPPSQIQRFDYFIDVEKHQSDLFVIYLFLIGRMRIPDESDGCQLVPFVYIR